MKRLLYMLSFIIFSLFINVEVVKAVSTANTGIYEVKIRSLPDVSSLELGMIPAATTITLLSDTEKTGSGCEGKSWFKINYNNIEGYACSAYLSSINWENISSGSGDTDNENDIDLDAIYKQELEKFPASYKSKIEALHKIYPNAIFKAKNVNVNFNTFATVQYQGYNKYELSGCPYGLTKGVSLLEDTSRSRDGLKSLDSWAYNPLTDTFNTNFTGGEQNRWYIPSLNTVKYYLDPRNFLNTQNIFMFEELTYSGDYYTEAHIEKLLEGTFMHRQNVTGKTNTTFAKAFLDAAKKNNLSPYFLVPRVVQEVGTVRTTMVSGTWKGYSSAYYGYYNFYNINAAGDTKDETIKNGLEYAKQMGWNNEYDAIVEGASFISNDYISVGQDTTYFQKFDIYGPCYGLHQYQQNIEAPYYESYKTYNGYNSTGMLNSNFVFVIPVYNNMPASTKLDDSRNSNNYLKDLTVGGSTVEGFKYTKNEYTINVSPLISSIEIAATKASSKSSVKGTGKVQLAGTSQTQEIKVTAENGSVRTYKITVTRNADIPIKISEILNTMLINSDGKYISGINIKMKANEFIEKGKEVDKNATILINDGKKKDEILATGDEVKITSGDETKTFKVVIYGDVDGNNTIDKLDALAILRHHYKYVTHSNEFKEAADADKNGVVDKLDALAVLKNYYGYSNIEQ